MSDSRRRSHGPGESGPLLFVLGLVVGLLCALIADRLTLTLADRDIELVRAVRNLAIEDFVGDVDSDRLIDDALRGMMSGLDEHSRFYGPEEVAQISRETSGEFRGIGVVFQELSAGRILFAFPGSPADRAGLHVGDRFLEVDGEPVEAMAPGDLRASLQREDEDSIEALVEDLEGERRTVVLHPERVLDPTIRHARMLDGQHGVGYVSIHSFSHRTPEEFDLAVESLLAIGLEGLIVDLRHNPGGILDSAVQIANRFIAEGTIVATRTRTDTTVTTAEASAARYKGLPLVVLIDGGSASASEVLAGALQDHSVAVLIGDSSYGKGTVQTLRPFAGDRGIVKLTTATYFTPAWRPIEREENGQSGISPDHVVEIGRVPRSEVYRFLENYSPPAETLAAIEAWESREDRELYARHPADVQLEAAVALLNGEAPDSETLRVH